MTRPEPLRFGLIGAGPWAKTVHAPAIAAHPATELVSIWARRTEAAAELAAEHGASVAADPDALIAEVDVVAFAVPPGVQAEIAVLAAAAGRHLVLEKPIGADVADAERLVDAVGNAGVASIVLLTRRYAPEVIDWLADAAKAGGWVTGAATWYGGALLGGPFSKSPWRHERGGLLDVGPHTLDLLDAALGPITDVQAARRGAHDVTHLVLAHENGVTSTASLSLAMPMDQPVVDVSLYGEAGRFTLPAPTTPTQACYANLLTDLTDMLHSGHYEHRCDVRRGLHLQRLIDKAEKLALA
ncbi:MAG TPA: Gfo/Idh/MocA family oxidoreductase [Pseudonocardiaceae bacterium]|jgi:predicted dehydrogenase|nr:Gfo/Idh/MocA family oxidoreductase [Pseudonocardiaceae bacterium]